VLEFAMALVLLTGAALFLSGLDRFTHRNPGWRTDDLLIGQINLPNSQYARNDGRRIFFELLLERLRALPGVEHATVASSLPIGRFSSARRVVLDGQPQPPTGQEPLASYQSVAPGYFEALGIPLLQGRAFNSADNTSNAPAVVVINETMARHLWPNENPLGRRLAFEHPQTGFQRGVEVVGIVSDVRLSANLAPPETPLQAYRPSAQSMQGHMAVALRSRTQPDALADVLRRTVAELDPQLPVFEITTARQAGERLLANYSLISKLLGGFALLGVLLAGLGIYGVIAGFVNERTNEIGLRFALGAQLNDIFRLVLGLGFRLSIAGLLLGLAGAFGVERLLSSAVPELPASNAWVLGALSLVLLLVALVACWLPARRASRVHPMEALRCE